MVVVTWHALWRSGCSGFKGQDNHYQQKDCPNNILTSHCIIRGRDKNGSGYTFSYREDYVIKMLLKLNNAKECSNACSLLLDTPN